MSYRILEIEITRPLTALSLSEHETGIAIFLRRKGKPIAFWMEAAPAGLMLSAFDLARKIYDKARDKILAESIREELITEQKVFRFPSLTIAICTKDRALQLEWCLDSVRSLKTRVSGISVSIEIIVVDNASSDEQTRELIANLPNVHYFCEERPGLNFARNHALRKAKGELLAFLDDDVIVDHLWLEGLMEAWTENPEAGAFTGLVLPYELATRAQILFEERGGWRKSFDRIVYGHSLPGNTLYPCGAGTFGTGANMTFRRDVLQRIGGFDEALDTGPPLPGGGDLDIYYRVIRGGYLLVYDPKYMVFHEHRKTVKALRQQYHSWGLCFMAFASKSSSKDPSQKIKFRKLIRLWFKTHLRLLRKSLTDRSMLPPTCTLPNYGEVL